MDYPVENTARCVVKLLDRLRQEGCFPHEIGLFLGYPSEDVRGFMENGPRCCKCCGYWKVYGDEEKAGRVFAQYEKCTRIYCEKWMEHRSIDKLTVPSGRVRHEEQAAG